MPLFSAPSRVLRSARKEYERVEAMRRRRILYDSKGRIRIAGLVQMLMFERRRPVVVFVCAVAAIVGYSITVGRMSGEKEQAERQSEDERVEYLRRTGKLRADKNLALLRRQIDDPDIGRDLPSFTGQHPGLGSRLFGDDEVSSSALQDDRGTRSGF